MHEVYFSHSYSDEQINNYFIRLFGEQDIQLVADRKSKTWCVPKLERYLTYAHGFAAIVPRRNGADAIWGISPYIGAELTLARRARLPCLIFAEDGVVGDFHHLTPDTPVPFVRESPQADLAEHRAAIAQFRAQLDHVATKRAPRLGLRHACVFMGRHGTQAEAASFFEQTLKTEGFSPRVIPASDYADCLHGMTALDAISRSEVSVYCLTDQLSQVDIAMAGAHALCRPAFRLYHDVTSEKCEPDLRGLIRWRTLDALRPTLVEQLRSYRRGCVEVISLPTPTMKELVLEDWDPQDPVDLARHVQTDDPHLRQHLNAIRKHAGSFAQLVAQERHGDLCQTAYQEIQHCDWLYDFEPPSPDYTKQRIRSPREMHADTAGTCLDFTCLLAAILEAMQATPVILRFRAIGGAHALVGCWIRNRVGHAVLRDKDVIVAAVKAGDVLVLESTGAARLSGDDSSGLARTGGFLSYAQAKEAAQQLLQRNDVILDFLLDVKEARAVAVRRP